MSITFFTSPIFLADRATDASVLIVVPLPHLCMCITPNIPFGSHVEEKEEEILNPLNPEYRKRR